MSLTGLPAGPVEWMVDIVPPGVDASQWIRVGIGREQCPRTAVRKAREESRNWITRQLEKGQADSSESDFYRALLDEDAERAQMGWKPENLPFGDVFQEGMSYFLQADLPGGWVILIRLH